MNREIKFRAWDTKIKCFQDEDYCLRIQTGLVQGYYGQLFPEMELDQYTGLKDKNGKEIYEGDILHRHMNVYWMVVFEESKWVAKPKNSESGLYLDATQFIETEVIGNTHESPEPLKEKENEQQDSNS